jgi:putative SOS response-associated peptidase YedK
VAPVHAKAMPVILRTPDEVDRWMTAEWKDAAPMQQPLPDGALKIVATGQKYDHPAEAGVA